MTEPPYIEWEKVERGWYAARPVTHDITLSVVFEGSRKWSWLVTGTARSIDNGMAETMTAAMSAAETAMEKHIKSSTDGELRE